MSISLVNVSESATTYSGGTDLSDLALFMSGPDRPTFARMIAFFSEKGSYESYLHPREIMALWDSMKEVERQEWREFFHALYGGYETL